MGVYINPPGESKETWLLKNGKPFLETPKFGATKDELFVCLVFNPAFTAAAIAFSERELQAFTEPRDHRVKLWYTIPTVKLLEVCPELAGYLPKSEGKDDAAF